MTEFSSRVEVQRQLLQIVNDGVHGREELFSLSKKAIDRWTSKNELSTSSELVHLLYSASSSIFVMASLSDDPIAGDYLLNRTQVEVIANRLTAALALAFAAKIAHG